MATVLARLRKILRPLYYLGPKHCPACGRWMRTLTGPAMWPELGAEWELSDTQYAQIDRREGRVCPFCWSNERVRLLARTLLKDMRQVHGLRSRSTAELALMPEKFDLRIAEINAVTHLHPFLARLLRTCPIRSFRAAIRRCPTKISWRSATMTGSSITS